MQKIDCSTLLRFCVDNVEGAAICLQVAESEVMKTLNNYATTIKNAIAQLKEERQRIDKHIAAQEKLLEEIEPGSIPEIDPEKADQNAMEFTDSQRIKAVCDAVDALNKAPFGRNEVAGMVHRWKPGMFPDTKEGKRLFSNTFWKVINEYVEQKKIIEAEKGGGRKQTTFKHLI